MPRKKKTTVLWELGEQTIGKHLVLRHYLRGWLAILGQWNSRLLFIDGFAGPGEYSDGEDGSPLIVLDCVREHRSAARLTDVEVVGVFIESDVGRADHLQQVLRSRDASQDLTYRVGTGEFEGSVGQILDGLEARQARLAPTFVMVDPFGVRGVRMAFIERILANPQSECMISFMYEAIFRHRVTPEFEPYLDDLFACREWRQSWDMPSQVAKAFLHDLFKTKLKEHGARHVVPFELWRGNRHVYTLFFASGNSTGCNLMKECMWKVDRSGSFTFRGKVATRPTLFELTGTNDVKEPLHEELRHAFQDNWTSIEEVEDFVKGDGTLFCKKHLRRQTLSPLEKEKRIDVDRPHGGRGFPVNKGIKVRFGG